MPSKPTRVLDNITPLTEDDSFLEARIGDDPDHDSTFICDFRMRKLRKEHVAKCVECQKAIILLLLETFNSYIGGSITCNQIDIPEIPNGVIH